MITFFTADEHYYHTSKNGGIIKYMNRPFSNIDEMNERIILNNNEVVKTNDRVIHVGDTFIRNIYGSIDIIKRLKGKHIFLKGSHDKLLKKINKKYPGLIEYIDCPIYELILQNKYHVVVCHYCMETWPRSHYNSLHLFAHSHGRLKVTGKRHDIGVDTNNYYPYSENDIIEIMNNKLDNPNYIKKSRRI